MPALPGGHAGGAGGGGQAVGVAGDGGEGGHVAAYGGRGGQAARVVGDGGGGGHGRQNCCPCAPTAAGSTRTTNAEATVYVIVLCYSVLRSR
jgi:hypothetical protein